MGRARLFDGPLVSSVVHKVRKDWGVTFHAMNYPLRHLHPSLERRLYFIGKTTNPDERRLTLRELGRMSRDLESGRSVIIFPSGSFDVERPIDASQPLSDENRMITGLPWTDQVGRFVADYQATVVPLFLHYENPRFYYQTQRIDYDLRRLFYGTLFSAQFGRAIRVSIGDPIEAKTFAPLRASHGRGGTYRTITQSLRRATYQLGDQPQATYEGAAPGKRWLIDRLQRFFSR